MQVESHRRAGAVSPRGAIGLMQVMPGTYATLAARYGLGSDPRNPRDNVLAGAAYLREMYDRYGPIGMLAAYNAGPGRWEDHLVRARRCRTKPSATSQGSVPWSAAALLLCRCLTAVWSNRFR